MCVGAAFVLTRSWTRCWRSWIERWIRQQKTSGDGGCAMPASRLGFDSVLSRQTSCLRRIRENLQSVWTRPRVALAVPRSADGLPIHLLDERRAGRNVRAQFGSIGAHAIICGGLILAVWHPAATNLAKRSATGVETYQSVEFAAPKWMREAAVDSAGKLGTGGDRNPLPPTAGDAC